MKLLLLDTTNIKNSSFPLYILPLILAGLVHIWNPIGFPSIHADEGTYMLRAMQVLIDNTLLPEGQLFWDHPFFGQIFLAAALGLIGYPDSLQPSADGDVHSIEMIFIVPRVLMGLLAVADTFLIYKIAEIRYRNNRTIAFIAAILFAVMPITWILRRILLDNLLLPFLLSSILFAVSLQGQNSKNNNGIIRIGTKRINKKYYLKIVLSGVFLGLAIFTKIPAFCFIPLVSFLVLSNTNRNFKSLALWFIPVILIPAIWPMYAAVADQFGNWFGAIIRQATERENKPLIDSFYTFFHIDPILFVLGIASIVYTLLRKDFFILFLAIPYLIFLQLVEFVSVYHLVLLLPAMCIASSRMIYSLSIKIKSMKVKGVFPFAVVSILAIFALWTDSTLVALDFNSSYFILYSVFVQLLHETTSTGNNGDDNMAKDVQPTVVGRFWTKSFLWATQYVFEEKYKFVRDDSERLDKILTESSSRPLVLIVDNKMKRNIISDGSDEKTTNIKTLYDLTHTIKLIQEMEHSFNDSQYPYSALHDNHGIGEVEVRSNQKYVG